MLAPFSSGNPKWRITRINNTDWYKITVDGTNLGLNVDNGRDVSGTNITLWNYSGAWQQFCFWDIGEGDYYLIQGHVGGKQAMVLDVSGGTSNPTANVQSYGHNNSYAQQWKLVKVGSGGKKGNGDVNNDGKVDEKDVELMKRYIVGTIHSLPNEQAGDLNGDGKISVADLSLMPETKTDSIKTLPDGWYQISPSHDLGRVLDVTGAYTSTGTNLQTWSNGNGNNQKFYLQNRGNGYISLKAGHCDLYITAAGSNSGANLAMGAWKGADTQLFQLIDGGNNVYHIIPKANTSLNFDCAGGWKNDGTNVQLWTKETASAHHKWKFTNTNEPTPMTAYNPEGNFDSVVSNNDYQITVKGWAFDRDDVNKQLEIHVYVGGGAGSGVKSYSILANKHRPDVNQAFPGVGDYHGFENTINVDRTGNQPVYVYAINIGGGKDNPELGHKTVAIKPTFQVYEDIARQTVPAYRDAGLTQRNGNERVDEGDHVTVLQKEGNSFFVDYPAGKTRKQRWVDKMIFEEPIYRQNALQKAKEMVEVRWTSPCDFVTWCSSEGVYNTVVDITGTRDTSYRKGRTYAGIPYSMKNRTYTKEKFLDYLSSHKNKSDYEATYYSHGKLTSKIGIDCSYFVWIALNASGAPAKIGGNFTTTSTLLNSGLFARRQYSNMKPGDIFLRKGSHVMMLAEKLGNGNCVVYEADARDSKCSKNIYNPNDLIKSGYVGYTFTGYGD